MPVTRRGELLGQWSLEDLTTEELRFPDKELLYQAKIIFNDLKD